MPTATDLVTDLPADFEVFGQAVDTDFVDLLGGTTGQVLSKTSATDLDFTWVTANPGDITGVTAGTGISGGGTSGTVTVTNDMATTITTNGDLIYGTGSGTYTRRAIGSAGQVLSVSSGVPAWTTASSGALTKISTQTFSGVSTVTFDSQFTSTYKLYLVSATKIITTSPYATATFRFRKGGVTATADYFGSQEYLPFNYSGYAPINTFNANTANLNYVQSDNRSGSASMYITNVGTGAGDRPTMWGNGLTGSSGGYHIFAGVNGSATTDFDGFIVDVAGCNMSGTISVYGVQA